MFFEKIVVTAFLSGMVMFILLLIVVFVSGSTFGQRCAAMQYSGSEWTKCVDRLSKGQEDF